VLPLVAAAGVLDNVLLIVPIIHEQNRIIVRCCPKYSAAFLIGFRREAREQALDTRHGQQCVEHGGQRHDVDTALSRASRRNLMGFTGLGGAPDIPSAPPG
jgi:hypothetical protein